MRVLIAEDELRLAEVIARGLRREGIGVLVVSSEPETVLSLADRILVMRGSAGADRGDSGRTPAACRRARSADGSSRRAGTSAPPERPGTCQ